ncbi:Verru_Chthon cassette protein D [Prosthecobacter vanneervenii]|uniref:Uncharacterized protein (TIGR02596 family) n=1 Tax=Prosthecobacter vanneervenii TaxID=48466 RepID=A0A7W7YBU0_9BACT|nr:Verru_Chthon cassette protein D [Prosthecobacter vanneervenii]MBB5033323.1 uncharacterized protein (TIGR02596 family) [Prosthecobacter vanneervenii]
MSLSAPRSRGFSLIEMLVVITIVVMLLALATPALTRTMQASRLSAAGEAMVGSLSEAQQTASSTNSPVEIRFFSFAEDQDQSPVYHAYQLFKITQVNQGGNGGAVNIQEVMTPVGNLVRLPEGIIIPADDTLSGAIYTKGGGVNDTKPGSSSGYSGVNGAKYNAIRFMPDGSCLVVGAATQGGMAVTTTPKDLSKNCFTLTFGSGTPVTQANLPKNFFVIQIDPYTGKVRSYKPGF